MKIKLIRNTMIRGKAVREGSVIDIPANEAKELIAIKKAVVETGKKKASQAKKDVKKAKAGEENKADENKNT